MVEAAPYSAQRWRLLSHRRLHGRRPRLHLHPRRHGAHSRRGHVVAGVAVVARLHRHLHEKLERLLNNLDHYQVVVLNTCKLEDGACLDALVHEIGHAHGLGHDGDAGNVMFSCDPNKPNDGLNHQQVAKICAPKRFNDILTLP